VRLICPASLRGLCFASMFSLAVASALAQQSVSAPRLSSVDQFDLGENPLTIRQPAQPNRPFSVTGQRGAIIGQQDGTFELWLLPTKILHNARLTAQLDGYGALIYMNQQASTIEVRPDHTTITLSHAAITIKEHLFIPRSASSGVVSAMVLLEIHSVRPAQITLSFEPSLERQWPAPNFGRPGAGWVPMGNGGAFQLEGDNPNFYGMVAMPGSTPGLIRPFQEAPKSEPLSFHIAFDPAKDSGRYFPLLAAVTDASAVPVENGKAKMRSAIADASANVEKLYRSTADFYAHFFDTRLVVETPDTRFNDAMRWAEISIEQSKVATSSGSGLAGGWFISGDSARPGFGWFFGRDTLFTLYAVNSYGDFALSRESMDFLLAHQREDGKMMHEYSQTADLLDWKSLPYLYAAADSTPLFVMQMADYVRASGDTEYLKQHWDNVKRAYAFTRAHTTRGIYDNSQGTGWVEEWVPKVPFQETYLAALDQQSSAAMAELSARMGDTDLATQAKNTAAEIEKQLTEFHNQDGFYNFSRDENGSFDTQPTVFPSVAWWDGGLKLPQADAQLTRWAGHRFSTDWGMRSMETGAATYDPISYHHGSVWPLYTGWTAMAQYRNSKPLAAYADLDQNIALTWLQDPGAITEVLSGEFYQPLGRSSSHQLWSSAMTLTPAVRGLFGVETDVPRHQLHLSPQLPAGWDTAKLHHVPFGDAMLEITMRRRGEHLDLDVVSDKPAVLCLQTNVALDAQRECKSASTTRHHATLKLPAFEVALAPQTTVPGETTRQWKVTQELRTERGLKLMMEGPSGTTQLLHLRRNGNASRMPMITGAQVLGDNVLVTAPATTKGEYVQQEVELKW
jgi:glycogen debranching enzyme